MLSRHFYVLTRLAATICNQQQSKILEIEWELQLHVMIFQNPSKESLFVTGALSQESSNKKVSRERP